jgi:hypothetical protein
MAKRNSWASHAIWGSVAVCAVLAAAVTIALVVGANRGMEFSTFAKRLIPAGATEQAQARAHEPVAAPDVRSNNHEIARLNDALRALAAERDRLADRLEIVERAVGDITASVRERPQPAAAIEPKGPEIIRAIPVATSEERPAPRIAAAPTQPVAPPPMREAPPSSGVIGEAPGGIFQPYAAARPAVVPPVPTREPMQIHATPLAAAGPVESSPATTGSIPPPSREPAASRTEFGVDLGSEPHMDALRARWANLRGHYGAMLSNLRPLVSVREGTKPGSVELRLIAGPLSNAGDAARTCASLQAKGVNCQTAVFDGQRLALN